MLAINILVDEGSIDIQFFSVMENAHDNLSSWGVGTEQWNTGCSYT